MTSRLEVLLAPAEFATLPSRDLKNAACVVFDVLRATSVLIQALANGATSVLPVPDIAAALRRREKDPEILLAGERNGLRIRASDAHGVEFDLGNSPREFSRERVEWRRIVMTTTNGTRALDACSGARAVLAASFSNLSATTRWLSQCHLPQVILIGAGTRDHSAWEDALAIGAVVNQLWDWVGAGDKGRAWVDDSARVVRELYLTRRENLAAAIGEGRNGQRLMSISELSADVAFCAEVDRHNFVVLRGPDGALRRAVSSR